MEIEINDEKEAIARAEINLNAAMAKLEDVQNKSKNEDQEVNI
jgi:hypothetical protein